MHACIMCSSREYPYSPTEGIGISLGGGGVGGSVGPNKLKKCMKLNWNFQEWGVLEKLFSMGEVWIFSVITQWKELQGRNNQKGNSLKTFFNVSMCG